MRKQWQQSTKYIILGILFLPFIILLVMTMFKSTIQPSQAGLTPLTIQGKYSYDKQVWFPLTDHNYHLSKNEKIWIKGNLDHPIPANECIQVIAEEVGIKLFIEGKEYLNVQQPLSFPSLLMSPGSSWYSFISPKVDKNDEVLIELLSYDGSSTKSIDNFLQRIYLGDGKGLYQMVFSQMDVFAIISILAILSGWVYMLEGIIYDIEHVKEGRRIVLLGFYLFSGGLWCATDALYPYLSLFISPPWFVSLLDILGIFIFPIALAMIVRIFIRSEKSSKVMNVVVYLAVLMMVSAFVIMLLKIANLYQQQLWIGCFGLLLLLVSFLCICVDLKKYKKGYMWLLLFAIIPTFVSIFLECINGVVAFMPRRIIMRYGFSLSVIIMITQFTSYAKTEKILKQKMEAMKEELVNSRISIMLSQIQPHFLYNALESIGDLCSKDAEQAENAITDFSLFLRGNLDSLASEIMIPFEKELEHTNYYLKLEKLRFGKRLCVKMNISVTCFRLPSLTLQPIVENAVRYGITQRKCGGTITISTAQDAENYIITIQDDGIGFDKNLKKEDGRSHIGLMNVEHRLKIQCNGTLDIHSIIQCGTTVILHIPKENLDEFKSIGNR